MSAPVVWKVGSSVLRDRQALPVVAAAIRREVALRPVLAVVSAFAGETDRLLAEGRDATARGAAACEEAVATAVATGETEAAARLALALGAVGVGAAVGEPRRLLTIAGPRLDGRPTAVAAEELVRLLRRQRVAIVPGFFGESEQGGAALLGRGGSDLSALLFAHALGGVRCRLVKDVDGVYEFDPAAEKDRPSGPTLRSPVDADRPALPAPRRFATLSYATALQVAGRLVQPKAIRFARTRRLSFEVGLLGSGDGTLVGAVADTFETSCREEAACA